MLVTDQYQTGNDYQQWFAQTFWGAGAQVEKKTMTLCLHFAAPHLCLTLPLWTCLMLLAASVTVR